jgi:membrane protease YdiL (CAAX protease family)
VRSARLVGLFVALVLVASVGSPIVATLTGSLGFTFQFARVWNRVFQVSLVLALVFGWRRLELGGPTAWGFRRAAWSRELATGLAIGFAGLGLGLVVAWMGGGLAPALRFAPLKTVWKALLGLAAAIVVGGGEEALFRGILLRRFVLDLGRRWGVLVTTVCYAVVHALRGGGKGIVLGPFAGFERTASLFAPLGDPLVWPGVIGLFALGLVLAQVRLRTGSLWTSVGIHAAWVAVFRVGRLFFDIRRHPEWLVGPGWPPLVGGFAGALALVTTVLVAWAWFGRRREAPIAPFSP